jgi:hypothetical protein
LNEIPYYKTIEERLTPSERQQAGVELADLITKQAAAERAKDDASKHHKSLVDKAKAAVILQASKVSTGKESRKVEVVDRRNEEKRTMETVRCDTGELVASRVMTDEEKKHVPLPFKVAKADDVPLPEATRTRSERARPKKEA